MVRLRHPSNVSQESNLEQKLYELKTAISLASKGSANYEFVRQKRIEYLKALVYYKAEGIDTKFYWDAMRCLYGSGIECEIL